MSNDERIGSSATMTGRLGRFCLGLTVTAVAAATAGAQAVRTEDFQLNYEMTPAVEFGSVVAGSGDWLVAGGPSGDRHYEIRSGGVPVPVQIYFAQNLQAADVHDGDAVTANDVNVIVWQDGTPDIGYQTGSAAVAIDGALMAYSSSDSLVATLAQPFLEGHFGTSVAIDGDTLVVGAPGIDASTGGGPIQGAGRAYVYRHDGSSWTLGAELRAAAPEPDAELGTSVALVDAAVAVGAPGTTVGGAPRAGRVLYFLRPLLADGFESGGTSAWSSTVP